MIRQPDSNPAGIFIDPQPVTTQPTEPQGQWRGLEVIRLQARELIRSFNPFYDPPNSQPPPDVADSAAAIDFQGRDGKTSHCLQFTALAGRAIAAYANMPPEINNALSYLATLAVAGRLANDQLNAFTAHADLVPEPGTHRETPDETPANAKNKTGKTSLNPQQQPDNSATSTLRASQLPNTSVALGALVGLSAVGASSASTPDNTPWVEVADAETLGKICQDAESCSNKYRLTKDIDGSQLPRPIGNETLPFTGKVVGDCRTIFKLPHCLIGHLSGDGLIDDLRFRNANITSTTTAGVAACKMSGGATISNIRAEHAYLATLATNEVVGAAIGVGKVNGGNVINTTAINCTVEASIGDDISAAFAGIAVGWLDSGIVTNTNVMNCTVKTSDYSFAGIGAGYLEQGAVTNTTAVNCNLATSGSEANSGIGAGENKGSVTNTKAVNCHIETKNRFAYAGIGAGLSYGSVTDTTAVNCTVTTSGGQADAGIGAGNNVGAVTGTTALNCKVTTSGGQADAGIGAGISYGAVTDTAAVNCNVTTSGAQADAGIGAGIINKGTVTDTKAFDSIINSDGKANITGGDNPVICNVRINGNKQTDSSRDCRYGLDNDFCANTDPSLVTPDCQPVKYVIDTSYCANATLTPLITETPVTVPSTNISLPGPASATLTPLITETPVTVPSANISLPGPASATLTTLTPTVASLGTGAITGIALGAAVFFVAAGAVGFCAYRYRQRSSSADIGRNEPMPMLSNSQPRTGRPLAAPPQLNYENDFERLLPACQTGEHSDEEQLLEDKL
ncbi:hypothetical protein [Endozoicomonas sp. ALE010]|uniref:hypothetical protein n=1 Tax=Endozoicomonas sp. ALE010 TaxID=3403081 RepID=UPI003BB488BE